MRCDLCSTWMLLVVLTGASVLGASGSRSAAYWIRWSSCGGVDAAEPVAPAHGGSGPERALLDDLLVSPGIVWDDGQDDELVVRIATCGLAVSILEAGASGTDGATDSDTVFVLARELLTAQLNLIAGVAGCPDVEHAVILAEDLLDTFDFDPAAPRAGVDVVFSRRGLSDGASKPARELAAELRRFNLGRGCARPNDDMERGGS